MTLISQLNVLVYVCKCVYVFINQIVTSNIQQISNVRCLLTEKKLVQPIS